MMVEIIGLIPARGGSKGLPEKNIKELSGKPLIGYSINAAKKSKFLNDIFVSTDNSDIATYAKEHGVEVINRPSAIARDASPIIDTINHTIMTLKEKNSFFPDIVVLLQPTSPLRNAGDIDGAIQHFLTGKFNSVISVCKTEHSPFWCFTISESKLKPLFNKKISSVRRQDLPDTYRPNGAIFISTPHSLKKYSGFMTDKIGPYIMPINRSIDIDTAMDFLLAELLIEKMKNQTNEKFHAII